jgi:hypothetical protein
MFDPHPQLDAKVHPVKKFHFNTSSRVVLFLAWEFGKNELAEHAICQHRIIIPSPQKPCFNIILCLPGRFH